MLSRTSHWRRSWTMTAGRHFAPSTPRLCNRYAETSLFRTSSLVFQYTPTVSGANPKRQSVNSAGLRIPPWRCLRVEHGSARVVRAGGGVEGPERRRHPALPRLHVRELVLRVRKSPSRVFHFLRTCLYPCTVAFASVMTTYETHLPSFIIL